MWYPRRLKERLKAQSERYDAISAAGGDPTEEPDYWEPPLWPFKWGWRLDRPLAWLRNMARWIFLREPK